MVLSAIRKFEDGVADHDITREDTDFQTAFALAEKGNMPSFMLTALSKSERCPFLLTRTRNADALPADREFTCQEAVEIGLTVGIKELTVGKSLNRFPGRFLEQPVKYGLPQNTVVQTLPPVQKAHLVWGFLLPVRHS